MPRSAIEVQKLISDELQYARTKHPIWPTDVVHRASIIADQSGGVPREALKVIYQGTDMSRLEKEVLHTAVVCIRWLEAG